MPRSPSRFSGPTLWAIAVAYVPGCANPTAVNTVALGDNPEVVEVTLDEDVFHCVIQPKVITEYRCAQGNAKDGGGCHTSRSALRLVESAEAPRCSDGRVIGSAPPESLINLERVRTSIGPDSESSAFYRRPVGLDSHPRKIFSEDSAPARLVRDWLDRSGT